MIAKVKKSSSKAGKIAPKKTTAVKSTSTPAASLKAAPKAAATAPKEHKSALHRMMTAEGWKRMMMKKD